MSKRDSTKVTILFRKLKYISSKTITHKRSSLYVLFIACNLMMFNSVLNNHSSESTLTICISIMSVLFSIAAFVLAIYNIKRVKTKAGKFIRSTYAVSVPFIMILCAITSSQIISERKPTESNNVPYIGSENNTRDKTNQQESARVSDKSQQLSNSQTNAQSHPANTTPANDGSCTKINVDSYKTVYEYVSYMYTDERSESVGSDGFVLHCGAGVRDHKFQRIDKIVRIGTKDRAEEQRKQQEAQELARQQQERWRKNMAQEKYNQCVRNITTQGGNSYDASRVCSQYLTY